MFIDTHAHLMFENFKGEVPEVVARAKAAGVEKIINIGCDMESCEQAVEMLGKYEGVYATLGLHPYDADLATEELMKKWEKMISDDERILAIGECGLDYFKAKIPREVQMNAFRLQLELAAKLNVPVVVHNRDADEDTFEILSKYNVSAVFHCYGSSIQFARRIWNAGYYTSFTGIITYPNAEELREVVKEVPLDKFMIETDCPYLAPQQFRGQRNEPAYVVEVAKQIAEIKNLPLGDIERISTENAQEFFLRLI